MPKNGEEEENLKLQHNIFSTHSGLDRILLFLLAENDSEISADIKKELAKEFNSKYQTSDNDLVREAAKILERTDSEQKSNTDVLDKFKITIQPNNPFKNALMNSKGIEILRKV